jgi:hypothetical protein
VVSDVAPPVPPARPRPSGSRFPDAATIRRRRLVLATMLVVGAVATGVVWTLDREADTRGPHAGAWSLEPHTGLAAWVDAFDWSTSLGGDAPVVDEDAFEAMADLGIQTVYLQTSHLGVPDQVVLERERLESLIDAAHDNDLSVVAWYLPTLADIDVDLDRLLESAALDVEGLAVDIESTVVADPAVRNARLLELSDALRAELPDKVIGAITPSAVHLGEVNPDYWPDFPWPEVAETYDLILPMTYWSIRLPEWRDGNRYVGENIDRIRVVTEDPDIPIHVIGGIADEATVDQVRGMLDAIEARSSVSGAGLYDWATSSPEQWAALAPLRDRRVAATDP